MQPSFWLNKRVFITGHTGFKGSWLTFWLQQLGAKLYGYALPPKTVPNLFELLDIAQSMEHIIGDIRDLNFLQASINNAQPEIVIHMAAQALVRHSYAYPVETYSTNVLGTVHILEAARHCNSVKVLLNVTSDKCYANKDCFWEYEEKDPMGGQDPYSSSKGCAELITNAYHHSFYKSQNIALASARAGNVIGGGDWSEDRLIPDIIHSLQTSQPLKIRYPHAIRPWQHVLEPLFGYLQLIEKCWHNSEKFSASWNFGPDSSQAMTVIQVANYMLQKKKHLLTKNEQSAYHEVHHLALNNTKAKLHLGWNPKLNITQALDWTNSWYEAWIEQKDLHQLTKQQINDYLSLGET